MPKYDKRQLYIKRVLREIRRHSDDRWIDIEIESELRNRFGDKPDAEAVAAMPSWRLTAINYRTKYFESAESVDGFTPHAVKRLIRNFCAPAVMLLAVFAVFRLFPTTEYVAYAVCALAAIAAAIQQHVCFCKLKYMLVSMIVPQFLLLWYPAKAAAVEAGNLSEFFRNLFSDGNRYILILIFATVLFYAVTAAVLHARDYADKPLRPAVISGSLGFALIVVFAFSAYSIQRAKGFDRLSAVSFAELNSAYEHYETTGDSEAFLAAAKEADKVVSQNFHSRSKMDETYQNDFEHMAELFILCDEAKISGSFQALMDSYFTDFDETDPNRTLDTKDITVTSESLNDRFAARLSDEDLHGYKYADLHKLALSASGIRAELYAVIDDCHTRWIFSANAE
ncbi:MAG: hypothetical protein IKM29_00470 [Clostridia bacterium]|nr:hypothetical protein [Clostridia bacterium]